MKKLICLCMVLAMLTVGVWAAWEDVPEEHWAAGAIAEMEKLDIVNGFPDGTFRPDGTLTRAQFLAMVARAAAPKDVPEQEAGHDWWWNILELAEGDGLLEHLTWEPSPASMNAAISRLEAAELLVQANERWNGLHLTPTNTELSFGDSQDIPKAYAYSVLSATEQGLLEGYPDGTFRGAKTLTRAEGCTLIRRLLDKADLLAEGETQVVNTGSCLIKHRFLKDGGAVLTSVNQETGQVIQTLEVPDDGYGTSQELGQGAAELWRGTFGRTVNNVDTERFWGLIGYYTYTADGHFKQVTDRAVLDWMADPAGDGILAVSVHPGTRASFSGGGVVNLAGKEVLKIAANGTVTTLLSNTPAHGLNMTNITGVEDDRVRVEHQFFMGMTDLHCYEYAVENGKLRALVHESGAGYSGYTEEEAKAEQARLDAAGCGVGSSG